MYRRWLRPWWPARTLLTLVLPFAGLLVFGAVGALASNLVGNPGFESPFAGTQYEGTISPNFGNWVAYSFRHAIPLPSEVHAPSPVHNGSASGEIVDPAGVGSAVFVQDIQSFDPNSTYTFSGWVYPVAGEQYFTLGFGWDRGSAGRTTGGSGINITPTATEFSAWQQSGSPAPALTYNAWHHIQLVVNSATLTSELYVDGSCQGISPAGQPVPGGSPSTILIGDGSAPSSESHFYWDDVELVSGVQVSGCPGGSGTPSTGNPPPSGSGVSGGGRYVAMGDSYSSGEGTASYDRGTDTSTNKCHRSSEDASRASYPRLLQLDSSAVPSNMTFVACSGAVINDVLNRWQYPDQPPQVQALGSDVTLVTISIGGDDLGFKHVLEECVNEGPTHFRSDDTCVGQESELRDELWGSDPLNTRLINLYRAIEKRAPNARIVVMGYPRLFPPGSDNSCGLPGLRYMDSFKIAWLNQWTGVLDSYLEETVNASGVAEYVSTLNAMTDSAGVDHSACGNNDPWINELQLFHPSLFGYSVESFHPNPLGYVAFSNALLPTIDGVPSGASFTIDQGQIVGPSVTVPPAASWLTVGVTWPGSTITTSLISPKGKVISPHALAKVRGVQHEVGPTYEVYSIAKPEPGHWQIRALGVSVAAGGESVRISVRTERRRHRPPIARATARPTHGRAPLGVVLSARGSRAVEGRVARYVWEFGDGHKGKGRTTRHAYKHAGRYTALLDVIDTSGASTLASTKTITIRR
jgi:lysophospholipase L1-like esterase